MTKIKITTQIDLKLKEMFERLQVIHHQGYQEALERGVKGILLEINPTIINNEIIRLEQKIAYLKSLKDSRMRDDLSI